MTDTARTFDQVVRDRRSVRIHDPEAPFDPEAVTRSIERMQLAPNSSNLQLWEFHRIQSPEMKKKVAALCMGQPAAKTARELLVVVTRIDKWKEHARANADFIRAQNVQRKVLKGGSPTAYYDKILPMLYGTSVPTILKRLKVWWDGRTKPMYREVGRDDLRVVVHKSAALAAQTFMLSMKAEGYDTCPMEGIDSKRLKKLLGLPKQAEISMVIGMGTATPEGIYGPRFRLPEEEVVKVL